jgi:hypothetical protein
MKVTDPSGTRSLCSALGLAVLALVVLPAPIQALAADGAPGRPWTALDDKAPALPLAPTFGKGTDPEAGPYVLILNNTSKDSLTVSASVHLSVAFHANKKDREYPQHVIDSHQTWTIPDLAAGDKVTLTAEGYAPLELTVP